MIRIKKYFKTDKLDKYPFLTESMERNDPEMRYWYCIVIRYIIIQTKIFIILKYI